MNSQTEEQYDFTRLKGVEVGCVTGEGDVLSAAIEYAKREGKNWEFKSTIESGKVVVWRVK